MRRKQVNMNDIGESECKGINGLKGAGWSRNKPSLAVKWREFWR